MTVSCATLRLAILNMITKAKSSHIGACFSIVEILWVLYFRTLRINPTIPQAEDREICILSKAHAAAALYATLAYRGFFPIDDLNTYYQDGGNMPGHLDRHIRGVEASLGSLGHGLPIAIGLAIGHSSRIFVVLGDGECNEGSVWEAAMIAAHLNLNSITVIIDFNRMQSLGSMEEVLNQSNLGERWKSFGWEVYEVDGHDVEALEKVFSYPSLKPKAVIARTIKGKGVGFMEKDPLAWHYKSPNPGEYIQAQEEILKHA